MRRLLRRAIRYSFDLGIEQNFLEEIVPVIAGLYASDFPEVADNRKTIITVLVKEEKSVPPNTAKRYRCKNLRATD